MFARYRACCVHATEIAVPVARTLQTVIWFAFEVKGHSNGLLSLSKYGQLARGLQFFQRSMFGKAVNAELFQIAVRQRKSHVVVQPR